MYLSVGDMRVSPAFRKSTTILLRRVLTRNFPCEAWKDFYYSYQEFNVVRMTAWNSQAAIWRALGNTSAASDSYSDSFKYGMEFYRGKDPQNAPPAIRDAKKQAKIKEMATTLHPDPTDIRSRRVVEPKLQVRGIWKRVSTGKGARGRLGHLSLCWKGWPVSVSLWQDSR